MNKRRITLTLFMLFSLTALAQNLDTVSFTQLQKQISQLQSELKSQKNDFSKQILTANKEIKALQASTKQLSQTQVQIADSLGIQIVENEKSTNEQIANVKTNHTTFLRWGIVVGIVLLLLFVGLFYWLYKRQKENRSHIIAQLEKTKASIDEKLVAEFAKNAEVGTRLIASLQTVATAEPDHSLAIKLADEITLMERNITLMDASTKGLKQLNRSIGKLKDNLAANGYEIPELLGKPYNEGMKA
ncbi:MAG: hypothetical protein LBR36_08510, partial [Bacteroidales bacterium]|nr:hypothetical protein [Bacteroidales bacterium]